MTWPEAAFALLEAAEENEQEAVQDVGMDYEDENEGPGKMFQKHSLYHWWGNCLCPALGRQDAFHLRQVRRPDNLGKQSSCHHFVYGNLELFYSESLTALGRDRFGEG